MLKKAASTSSSLLSNAARTKVEKREKWERERRRRKRNRPSRSVGGRWLFLPPQLLFFSSLSLVAQKTKDSTHSETPHFGLTFSAKVREVKLENKIEIFNLFLF